MIRARRSVLRRPDVLELVLPSSEPGQTCRVCGGSIVPGSPVWRWRYRSARVGHAACGWWRLSDVEVRGLLPELRRAQAGERLPMRTLEALGRWDLVRWDSRAYRVTPLGLALFHAAESAPQPSCPPSVGCDVDSVA